MFAHQQGAATFSESTGQPEQSKLHQVVLVGLLQQYRTTRTYVGGSTAAEQDGSDVRLASDIVFVATHAVYLYEGCVLD